MIAIVYPSPDLQTHAGIEPANPAERPTTHCTFLGQWLVCCLLISLCCACTAAAQTDRQIAITVDDLPASNSRNMDGPTILDINTKITATLRDEKIPAIGFVNEDKLYKSGEVDQRIQALAVWLDAGLDLGNHTFSHLSLNRGGLQAFEEDIVRGETVTRLLLKQHKMTLSFFRHPYLDTGRDLQTRREAEAFLAARGYRIAPVTVDAWDWMFGAIYEDAKKRGDTAMEQELVRQYLAHTDAVLTWSEQLSRDLVGYPIKQILLLHANQMEAEHLKDVLDLLRKRGYSFISLGDALADPAYSLPDTYVGEEGTDWLMHWAITRGKLPQGFPEIPKSMTDRHKALPRPANSTD